MGYVIENKSGKAVLDVVVLAKDGVVAARFAVIPAGGIVRGNFAPAGIPAITFCREKNEGKEKSVSKRVFSPFSRGKVRVTIREGRVRWDVADEGYSRVGRLAGGGLGVLLSPFWAVVMVWSQFSPFVLR